MIQLRILILSLILIVLLVGCGPSTSSTEKHTDAYPTPADAERTQAQGEFGGRIIHPLLRPPRSFNPLASSDSNTNLVTSLTHGTLLELDRTSMRIVPGLAKSWKTEGGGKQIRLSLRRGVRFSDGQPFGADDVIFTFDAIYAENSHNVRKDDLILRDRKIKCTRVADDEVLLEFPFTYTPALYLLSTVPVLPRHKLQALVAGKPIEVLMGVESSPDQCVGLGPFRIKQAKSNEQIILEANPHYWRLDATGRRLPYLAEVILPVVNSRDSAFMQFRSGVVDMVDWLRVEDYVSLAKKQSESIEVRNAGASTDLQMLWVNQNTDFKSPKRVYFNNPVFRRALAQSIDRNALVQKVFRGQATILTELWPPSLHGNTTDLPPYLYDPAGAIALFARAGLKMTERNDEKQLLDAAGKPFSLVLLTNTDRVKEAMATMLQEDFRKVGIKVQISPNDQRTVIDRFLNRRDYEMVLFSSIFPPEPADLQSVLKSRGEQHMWNPGQKKPATAWEAEIDRLTDDMVTADAEKSRQVFHRIQRILMQQMPLIPLVAEDILVGLRKNVRNVRPSVIPPHLLWNSWELYVK